MLKKSDNLWVSTHCNRFRTVAFNLLFILFAVQSLYGQADNPHLQKTENGYQLIVEGKPFLMFAGELGNSTATTMESMAPVWPRLKQLHLNTILIPVYWELLEPEEGKFDFQLIDDLVAEARNQKLKVVLLWFGSWKNSMSSHAPAWVKVNQDRFPRAKSANGISQEILSPFYENNLQADLNAYVRLLTHIKEMDQDQQTVVMIQTENEIGMLPSARDFSQAANNQFKQQVPEALLNYMQNHKKDLHTVLLETWKKNGFKTSGTWEDVFGKGLQTDEIFMAYYFALYTNRVCAAGKKAYALPAYVNAALNAPGKKPGEYPSAGPLPHVLDVWKAAAPDIDFYSPDFYNPDFEYWNDLYVQNGNPLFIPEHQFDMTVAAKALYAFGHYRALGFSPFAIEQIPENPLNKKEEKLAGIYNMLSQIQPLLTQNSKSYKIDGVLLDKSVKTDTFMLGDYEFTAKHTYNFGWEPNAKAEDWETAAAIIIQTGDQEFYYAGFGVSVQFRNVTRDVRTGILKAERGYFKDGKWVVFQHLNGDQTHQGRHIRSFVDDITIQKFSLYDY